MAQYCSRNGETDTAKNVDMYDLPCVEWNKCCEILDESGKWEELVVYMQLGNVLIIIERIKLDVYSGRSKSPTDNLLKKWSSYMHTVDDLFILLYKIKEFEGMKVLKNFVSKDLLIKLNINSLVRNIEKLKIDNIDNGKPKETQKSEKILNGPQTNHSKTKLPQMTNSDEDNENIINDQVSLKPKSKTSSSSYDDSAGLIPQVSYADLQKSTNNWDTRVILGKGGFGTVFKGSWKCTLVAIKRIELKENGQDSLDEQIRQSRRELYCLNSFRHDNILPLYAFSKDGPQPCLVYQYMPGGSLEQRLRIRDLSKTLSWPVRLDIAIGTARGLQYLHTLQEKEPLVHGDIKSANILLEHNNNPRIGDFGLAREGPERPEEYFMATRIQGTRAYLPAEFLRKAKFSTKVDTYSFGIVLFEIATALPAYSERRNYKFLKDHVENCGDDQILGLKDQRILGGENYFRGLLDIGNKCVKDKAKDRPEMVSVLIDLEQLSHFINRLTAMKGSNLNENL